MSERQEPLNLFDLHTFNTGFLKYSGHNIYYNTTVRIWILTGMIGYQEFLLAVNMAMIMKITDKYWHDIQSHHMLNLLYAAVRLIWLTILLKFLGFLIHCELIIVLIFYSKCVN